MASRQMFKTKSRRLAFLLFLLFGGFVILLGLLVLALGLAITHHDDFHDTMVLKEQVNPGIDYVQYWIGLPFIITGISIACSAVNLRRDALTICTLTLSIACIVLSLAGLVVDGPDWVKWKNYRALQQYWERQDGYACVSKNDMCLCEGKTSKTIASFTDCDTIGDLAATYGVLIACFIIVLVILLSTIILMVYVLSSKAERARRSGNVPQTIIEVIGTKSSRREYDEPTAIPNTNRGYDKSLAVPRTNRGYTNEERTRTIQTAYKNNDNDSLNYQNRDGNVGSGAANGGIMMLDPAHFKLGDDDVLFFLLRVIPIRIDYIRHCPHFFSLAEKKWISLEFDCSMLERLNHTYGAMVCCILVGIFLALSSIVVVLILIPMKQFTVPPYSYHLDFADQVTSKQPIAFRVV